MTVSIDVSGSPSHGRKHLRKLLAGTVMAMFLARLTRMQFSNQDDAKSMGTSRHLMGTSRQLMGTARHLMSNTEFEKYTFKSVTGSDMVRSDTSDMFSVAFNDAYKKVINDTSRHFRRYPFQLSEWKRKTAGGLEDPDRALLGELFYNAGSLFEFGLGESTYIASETNIPRYAGVDSDPSWIALAREGALSSPSTNLESWTDSDKQRKGAHFRFYFADIGPTGRWGYPQKSSEDDFHLASLKRHIDSFNYQFSALEIEKEAFEIYLVDGRFRVACAALSFMHAISRGGDMSKVRVIIHDIGKSYRGYSVLLGLTEIVNETSKLWVLKLRPNVNSPELFQLWLDNYFTIK